MCMNFYPINKLKTKTLLEYIDNLIKPNIDEKKFYAAFGFGIQDLTEFFNNINNISDYRYNIIELNESNTNKKILDLFYINANEVNKDYGTKDLSKVENIFALNPIIKYKNSYYLIGFEYFKMNFYNTLVEKIIKKLDKDINRKIGTSIDSFVKSVFDKKLFTTFSGKYKVSKGQELESDLAIELTNDIILIENKNKYLTNISFSGNGSHILKDYIYSFVFSQTQLLKHEKNLRKHQQLSFNDGKVLYYNNKNIIKISVSTNNWYSIVKNKPITILPLISNIRFDIKDENLNDFKKANEYLDNLTNILQELNSLNHKDKKTILTQSTFIPLELIIEKQDDENFIERIKSLVRIILNVDNPLDAYDYISNIYKNSTKGVS